MSMSTPPSSDHMRRGDQEPPAAAHSGAVPTLHAAAAHRPPTDVQTCCVLMAARARARRTAQRAHWHCTRRQHQLCEAVQGRARNTYRAKLPHG